jgi:hypothetical protein
MNHGRVRLTMLAGWLFADLFLVLLIAGLATLPAKPSGSDQSPSPSPSPAPSKTHEVGLDPAHIDFNVDVSPSSFRGGSHKPLLDKVNSELRRRDPSGRQVGFVLVFASGPQGDAGTAVQTATKAFKLLKSQSRLFANSTGLGYWSGDGDHFEFKIFLLR